MIFLVEEGPTNITTDLNGDILYLPTLLLLMSVYRYDKDMNSVVSKDGFEILTNGSMKISDVHIEDEGMYYCTAANSKGNMTISAYIDVRSKFLPKIAYDASRLHEDR